LGNPTGRIFGKDGWTFVDISQKIPKQKRNIDQQIAGTKTFFKLLNREFHGIDVAKHVGGHGIGVVAHPVDTSNHNMQVIRKIDIRKK
jgi:hypothetical protein